MVARYSHVCVAWCAVECFSLSKHATPELRVQSRFRAVDYDFKTETYRGSLWTVQVRSTINVRRMGLPHGSIRVQITHALAVLVLHAVIVLYAARMPPGYPPVGCLLVVAVVQ